MTLFTCEIFEAVVKERSFQRASEILNMTPSAVSHAISSMEKEVGFSLFIRGKQETVLTTNGELLLPYVREILKSEESLRQAVSEIQGLEMGTVKIGGFNSVCSMWMPKIVKEFQKSFPNIRIEIYQGTYENVVDWLNNGTIDIALISRVSVDGFYFKPLYHDRLMCVVPKGLQLKNKDFITFEEMKSYWFVTQWQSCDADVKRVLRDHDINISTYCHVVDDMSTVAMVEAGLGICILPELLQKRSGEKVDWYPMEEDCYREIGYGVSNPKTISPATKKLIEVIEQFVQEI